MSVELTEMSYEEYNRIRTGQMTPAMASEYLKEGRIALRSFRECLMEMVPGRTAPEVAAVLQEALAEAEPEADRKSIARKVRNWLSGQNHPTNREDIQKRLGQFADKDGKISGQAMAVFTFIETVQYTNDMLYAVLSEALGVTD